MHMTAAEDRDDVLLPHHSRAPLVTALCVLLMSMEGLDSNVISYISPLLRKEYDMSVEMIGVIYSVTVAASLAGAVLLGPLSDRFGRRPLLIISSLVLSLCSLATPLIHTPMGLIGLRFLIGLAFGAAVPVTFSLVAEFAPPHRRSLLIMLTSSGVGFGYMLAGMVSATVIPVWGWRVLMYGLGGASLAAVVTLFLLLPESPEFVTRGVKPTDEAAPEPPFTTLTPAPKPGLFSILKDPYLVMTLLIWVTVASVYAVEFMFGYWLPTLLMNQGYSISAAGYITATGKIGGITGSLIIGWMMDRWGIHRVLSNSFMLGAALLCLLPLTLGSPLSATCGILLASFAMSGTFSGSQALAVTSYPPSMRATATGWISGFARFIGGGSGALVGGAMLGAGYGMGSVCLLMAAWMVVGCIALLALGRYKRTRMAPVVAAPLLQAAE